MKRDKPVRGSRDQLWDQLEAGQNVMLEQQQLLLRGGGGGGGGNLFHSVMCR